MSILKAIGRLFRKEQPKIEKVTVTVKAENPASLYVLEIDPESTDIAVVLGISESREEELKDLVMTALHDEDTFTKAMVAISRKVIHANELAFTCFQMGAAARKRKEGMDSLLDMLKKLGDNE